MEGWFAVWTRSRHERYVCDQLAAKSVETFLPTVHRVHRWSDRTSRRDWPLFPGYCFVHIEPAAVSVVTRCAGVVTVLSHAGKPAPVSDAEIDGLQRLVTSGLPYEECAFHPQPGTRVRVSRGPMAGTTGWFVREDARAYLLLAVELLGTAARVWVSADDVEFVAPSTVPTRVLAGVAPVRGAAMERAGR